MKHSPSPADEPSTMNVVPDRGERRTLSNIDIAILAGGLGTRLSSVLPDAPKVMAPVGGRPFLAVLLRGLIGQGARRVLLCLGSKAQVVKDYLARHSFPPLEIRTVVEARPLGTAGALAFAAAALQSDPVMVLNGDTLIRADLEEFLASHKEAAASVSVLCVKVADARRYGRVEIGPGGRVTGFAEKNASMASAWVNAGAYLLDQSVLARIVAGGPGSLERDVLESLPPGSIHAYRSEGSFLDIGTPESLREAEAFLTMNSQEPV